MSCYLIKVENGHKVARSINTKEEYLALRGSSVQQANLRLAREGNDAAKRRLVQFNYSCLPNDDGSLKGATKMSTTVGMDIDHIEREQMGEVRDRILAKKDELGLLMLELSARGEGYHLVFRRRQELSQEENLQWASELLGVEFDRGAKDITRVFFTTTASPEDLIYLDEELFENIVSEVITNTESTKPTEVAKSVEVASSVSSESSEFEKKEETAGDYLGIGYDKIIRKWWELYNDGQEPVKSNRNTLTFELAVNLRHICGFDRVVLDKVIPCYDGFSEQEKLACIDSALAEKRTQMPKRLKEVLFAVRSEELAVRSEELFRDAPREQARRGVKSDELVLALDEASAEDDRFYYNKLPKLPLGVRDSVDAVGPSLSLPVLTAICPAIGMLATGVKLDVHKKLNSLNLIAYYCCPLNVISSCTRVFPYMQGSKKK